MNLRAFLQTQGLTARDIDEAVREARKATRVIHFASGASVEVFTKAAARIEHPKVKAALFKSAVVAAKVHEGTRELLRKR
jgi:hypothetical protein